MTMSPRVANIASFTPKPGHRDRFLGIMGPMIEATRTEPGNELYDLYEDADGDFHLLEVYRDAAAVEAHRSAPHFAVYRATSGDTLAGPARVQVLTAVDIAEE